MRAQETAASARLLDYSDSCIEKYGQDDGSVTEIDGSRAEEQYGAVVDMSGTVKANSIYLFQFKSMSVGETINITTKCSDSSATYMIGIKNQSTGELVYVSGTGTMQHEFAIPKDGRYAAFVENNNDFSIDIVGSAIY